MTKEYASGEEINVIWYDDIGGWYQAIETLKGHGIDTSKFILVKRQMSDDAGIGIKDPELFSQIKMILS